jgi:hypothetical protein
MRVDEPGEAHAYQGQVVIDGPDGVAVTMTPAAAREMAKRMLAAADAAESHGPDADTDA